MRISCSSGKWIGLLTGLALLFSGCNDFFFETPEFDNPHDPINAGPDDPINAGPVGCSFAPQDVDNNSFLHTIMASVPDCTFVQQDVYGNSFQHTISAFEIAKYQVTYELWYTVRVWGEDNGYVFENFGSEGSSGTIGGAPTEDGKYEPVTRVSWRETIVWLNAYSEMDELTPVYYTDADQTIPIKDSNAPDEAQTETGLIDNPYVNWDANGYRLPTEGEYQVAASYQDGTDWTPPNHASGATADYSVETATSAVAWYNMGYSGNISKTQPVGTKAANQLGIYDMSGNAWEWIWDRHEMYPSEAQTDYRGPETDSWQRVIRGGSWSYHEVDLQVGYRSAFYHPWDASHDHGFRPARTVP